MLRGRVVLGGGGGGGAKGVADQVAAVLDGDSCWPCRKTAACGDTTLPSPKPCSSVSQLVHMWLLHGLTNTLNYVGSP